MGSIKAGEAFSPAFLRVKKVASHFFEEDGPGGV
jgi:hypothetical protein